MAASALGSETPTPGNAGAVSSWSYHPALDGVRCLAVVVTVFFHAGVERASGGFIGLDLFFVLSGFLVSSVLLAELDDTGELRLGRFFARRVRRLLPAAVATILVTCLVFVLVASQPERLEMVRQARAALLYVANWQFIADGSDYFAGDIRESPFMHFWSLSVEEQFYVFLPVVLLVWLRFTARRGTVLLTWLIGLTALSVASQLVWAQLDPTRAYYATDTRLFQLLAGVLLAVGLRELARARPDVGTRWPRLGGALAGAGLLGTVLLTTTALGMTASHRSLLATLAAGALILGAFTAPAALVARGLSVPSFVYLGKISYGTYLWHWPLLLVLGRVLEERPVVVAVLALGLSISVAAASYQLLETPIRRNRRLDPFPWPVVASGLSLSVLSAAVVVGPVLTSDRRPTVVAPAVDTAAVEEAAGWADRPVPDGLDFERADQDHGPAFRSCPDDPADCLVVDGAGPHLVLVGDSHARMLAGALTRIAEEKGYRFSMSIAGACPWLDGLVNRGADPTTQERCREAREGFYDSTLPAMEPDLVLLSGLARDDEKLWGDKIVPLAGDAGGDLHEMQRRAVQRTVTKIAHAGARTVIFDSILGTGGWDESAGFDPLDCLARAERLGECAVSPSLERPFVDGVYETVDAARDDVATVDLNPLFCPDEPRCRPVLDDQVVWRDDHHVTAGLVTGMRDRLWDLVQQTGLAPRPGAGG